MSKSGIKINPTNKGKTHKTPHTPKNENLLMAGLETANRWAK
jgi:hypothetical protein